MPCAQLAVFDDVLDGDGVRVARQISQHCLRTAERSLAVAVDDPFGFAQQHEACGESVALGQVSTIAEELQAVGFVGGDQPLQEQSAEQSREHAGGEEEAGSA